MPDFIERIVDKWLGPSGLLVLFGAVIWGVQLNLGYINLIEWKAITDKEHRQVLIVLERLTASLEAVTKTARTAAEYGPKHEANAHLWKLKIESNGHDIESILSRLDKIEDKMDRFVGYERE